MTNLPKSSALLSKVMFRMRLLALMYAAVYSFVAGLSIYLIAFLVQRLTGLFPNYFAPETLAFVPAFAIVGAVLFHRRPQLHDAARRVDESAGARDLFLTVCMLDDSAGQFQSVVADNAEKRAEKVDPSLVVRFNGRIVDWSMWSTLAAAAVVMTVLFFPWQLDPFGKVAAAQEVENAKKELIASKKATESRKAQLMKKEDPEDKGEVSKDVKKAVDDLKMAFNRAKPKEQRANAEALGKNQKIIGEKWRKLSAEKLKDLVAQLPEIQNFGGSASQEKMEQWTKEMMEGSTESLQKEVNQIKDDLERLMKEKDPVKKAEMKRQLKKKMQALEDFATDKVNSKQLAAALKRAQKQLELTDKEGMSAEEVKEALQQSMELAKAELEEVKQSAKDLKELEKALETLQMAKKLNEQQQLDGEEVEGFQTLDDYKELYAQMMGEGAAGESEEEGEGTGAEGIGEGGEVPEDDSVETGFKTELSKSHVTAGKVLLSLTSKGLTDSGNAEKRFQAVQAIKEGVSEAILNEQIPPGYHEGIKGYFNNIDKTLKGKAGTAAPSQPEAKATNEE